jgi:hypothetical protein
MIAGDKKMLAEKKSGDWRLSQFMTRKVLSSPRSMDEWSVHFPVLLLTAGVLESAPPVAGGRDNG